MKPAPPLEWHPAYRNMTELLDWLENPSAPTSVKVAMLGPPPTLTMNADALYPTSDAYRTMVLAKHRAYGPAPYVGPRFHYTWWTAVDQIGRMISGESKICYEDETKWWLQRGAEPPGDRHYDIPVPQPQKDPWA